MVEAIMEAGLTLPGVIGEAATAARFAGQCTERHDSAAFPVEGQRIYELARVPERVMVGGRLRKASLKDRDLVVTTSGPTLERAGFRVLATERRHALEVL
jgi:hypothetical protein